MYFPLGWPKYLREPRNDSSALHYVISSCDRMLFAVVSDDTLSVWYSKPSIQIVSYTQSSQDIIKFGKYQIAEWKPDSSMIAVMTSEMYVIFFKVILDISVPNHNCLYVPMEGRHAMRKETVSISDGNSIPAIKISPGTTLKLTSNILCCICVRDELMIATQDGCFNRIKWTGIRNDKSSFNVHDLQVSMDFQQTKAAKPAEEDGYVMHMEYSPIIGGYVLVLSSGRAMFVIPPSSRQENSNAQGVWVTDLKDASCLAINHRYRLMAFGCKSAIGVVYVINEAEGTLEESHKLQVSSKDYPDAGSRSGPVRCMKWTPDGTALALCWNNGGFSLWSVFGSLLLCSLGGEMCPGDGQRLLSYPIISMEWALEGYQLWLVTEGQESEMEDFVGVPHNRDSTRIMQLQFVKSALTVNPCSANHEHVFLQGEDKLYINIGDNCSSQQSSSMSQQQMSIGNKIWQIVPISHQYLSTNWPIRYSAVDKTGQCLAVAGKTGLAHYTFFTRKWKLFGNETQEKDLVVSGGMSWWRDFICVASYNITGQRDEIRCYPRNSKLDNTFAVSVKVPSQILLLNTFKDTLTVFCIDSHIMLFNLERNNLDTNPTLELVKVQEVSLNNYVPHPVCVTGLVLTLLRTEFGAKGSQSQRDSECLLLNVAGKLLMFHRDLSGPKVKEQSQKTKSKPLPFAPPSVVATNVENLWSTCRASQGKMQLLEALWLSCGTQGMKVWLPLYPKSEGKAHNFLSKRIMLPFRVDIYPLAVLFEEAVILGAASDAIMYQSRVTKSDDKPAHTTSHLPFYTLERTSQIYLHHILRQLLRRNLGVNALDLARCCTELGYFPHVLELLLHEVLEAEATSKEPIPDPLLPRVVAFINEFPEFYQTVVHCARKTEVALWPYLFSTVGNPKDLFEQCLMNDKLETAASYLIILQNLERPVISRQHATLLLDKALEINKWHLARDLVRFLKAIEPSDDDTFPVEGSMRVNTSSAFTPGYPSPPIAPPDTDGFNFSSVSNISRIRSSSVTGSYVENVPPSKPKLKHTNSDTSNLLHSKKVSPKPKEEGSPDHMYIDMILCRHCRKLLESNKLRDIGYFSANIEGFQLVAWLRRERLRAAKVEDFVSAVRDIHHQFEWPLPILSYTVFQQLKDRTLSTPSLNSVSLLDVDSVEVGENDNHIDYHQYLATLRSTLSDQNLSQSDEVILKPHVHKTEESSLATVEASDNSSLLEFDDLNDSSSVSEFLSPELEILSQEMANKGPQQSELELRYLLQILLEAGCLEWAMIVSMVLRDVEAVVRTVNTASMTDTPLETVARMREGISFLELWAETECLGYKPFLHFIRKQIHVLGKLVEQTAPTLQLSSSPKEMAEQGPVTPPAQTIHNADCEPLNDAVTGLSPEAKPNECVVA